MFSRKKRIDRTQEFRRSQLRTVEKNLRNAEPETRKKRQHWLALGLVTISMLIAIYTLFFSPIFKVKEVIVNNESAVNSLDEKIVHDTFQYLLNKNIFLNSAASINAYGLRALPRLKNVQVDIAYPETIKVTVKEKQIVFGLPTKDQFALVNEDGVIVKFDNSINETILKTLVMDPTDQPLDVFYLNQQLLLPEQVSYILYGNLEITQRTGFKITNAIWYPARKEIHYQTDKGFSIWLDSSLTVDSQVTKLMAIYPQVQTDQAKIKYIDLRIPERAFVGK